MMRQKQNCIAGAYISMYSKVTGKIKTKSVF